MSLWAEFTFPHISVPFFCCMFPLLSLSPPALTVALGASCALVLPSPFSQGMAMVGIPLSYMCFLGRFVQTFQVWGDF